MSEMNPKLKVKDWLENAKNSVEGNWNAMCISTVDENNTPDSRMVLFKQYSSDDNLIFFTNYNSKKGQDIVSNESVCATFFWDKLDLQLRIKGVVKITSRDISEKYFNSRPFASRVAAIVSNQSNRIENYDSLHEQYERLQKELSEDELSCPLHWGGVEIVPSRIEFWEGHKNRLHKREVYELHDNVWSKHLISP
tara:strand:+ start:415 stop:999 length:585 start_codon:yes stop_codon:yes gene_type:complete